MKTKMFLAQLFLILLPLGCHAAEPANSNLELSAIIKGDVVTLVLSNASDRDQLIAPKFAYAGVGGGNIIGFISTPLGQVAAPCAKLDTFSAFGDPVILASGSRKVWRGSIAQIAKWHCLNPGFFSIIFAYKSTSGALVATPPMALEVSK